MRPSVATERVAGNAPLGAEPRRRFEPHALQNGISLIVTVRDDYDGLLELLTALAGQSRTPEEIVIVDGGSQDGTYEVLKSWSDERLPLRVVSAPGSNIAEGRNVAVRESTNSWIACTDAGCRPEPHWLEALDRGRDGVDLIAGVFAVDGQSPFQRVAAVTHYPSPAEFRTAGPMVRVAYRLFGRDFRARQAGGRSMAFSRRAFDAVDGFPEVHYAGEDLAFSAAVVDRGFKARLELDAMVRWRPPGTWRATASMFFTYCRGDIRSEGRVRHLARAIAWVGGPTALVLGGTGERAAIAAGAMAYITLPMIRARREAIPMRHWWRIPALVALKDLSQLAGAVVGSLDAARGRPQPNPHPAPPQFAAS